MLSILCTVWLSKIQRHCHTCTSMHITHTITHTPTHVIHISHKLATHYSSKQYTHTCSPTAHLHQHSVHLYKLLAVYCIDHVLPNPQGGRTLLTLAAQEGHLPVARLLVETYHCDVNEEDDKVSRCELMGGMSEHPTCVSSHM